MFFVVYSVTKLLDKPLFSIYNNLRHNMIEHNILRFCQKTRNILCL